LPRTLRGVSITRARRRRRSVWRRVRRTHPLLLVLGLVGLILLAREAWLYASAHPVIVGAGALTAAGAGVFVLSRRRRTRRTIAATDGMTGTQFEHYVAGLMRRCGFRAVRVTGRTADLGADIVASTSDGRRVVVQCKRYAGTVGSPHLQRDRKSVV